MSDEVVDYASVGSLVDLLGILREKGVPEEQFRVHLSRYQDRVARIRGIPLTGMFELTPLCNLNCKMCYVHLDDDLVRKEDVLAPSTWESIIDQACAMGMRNAALTGGECLIYPAFDEVYLHLRSKGIAPDVKTNGLLLNERRLGFFMRHKPKSITVSLYGSSNKVYERVTGYPVFDVVYENLQRLREAPFPVSISITPSAYMRDDLLNTFELARSTQLPLAHNIMLFRPRKETGRELCDLSADEYLNIEKALHNDGIADATPIDEAALPECGVGDSDPAFGIRCGAGRSSFNVDWHGSLTACENLAIRRVSLLEHSFSEAWNLVNADALLYPLPIECVDCPYDEVCFSCAAYRGNGAERGHCNPEVCKRTKLYVLHGLRRLQG